MKKAARKGRKVLRKKRKAPLAYFRAILLENPSARAIAQAKWIKFPFEKVDFHVIKINGGGPDKNECRMSRGLFRNAGDMVCWANRDNEDHVVQFINARWPFDPALNTNNESILVPAKSTSAWYQIDPGSGSLGLEVRYEYGIDIAPGPPGPSIISVD